MKLTESQQTEFERIINEGNSEKVYLQSTVVRVGILISLGLAILVFIWAISDPRMVQFKDVLTTLLVGFACTTLLYASKTFEHNRYVNIYRIHLDATKAESEAESAKRRKEDAGRLLAFDLMKDWHSSEMILHATIARTFFSTNPPDISAALLRPENIDAKRSIMVVLNYFERISLASQTKLADSSLLKSYFRGLFYGYYSRLEGYIAQRRKEPDSHRLFLQYTSTVSQWRDEER